MEQVANKTNVKSQAAGNAVAPKSAEKDAEFKAKKAAAAKKFAENQKKRKEELVKHAKVLTDLQSKGTIKMPEDTAAFFAAIANPPVKAAGTSRTDFFEKVFGNEAKVGDSITLMDYMKKTLQAKGTIDKAIKTWAEKGIVVEYQENKAEPFNSKYVIKAMPKA